MEIAILIVIICGVLYLGHILGIVDEHITYNNKSLENIDGKLDEIVKTLKEK